MALVYALHHGLFLFSHVFVLLLLVLTRKGNANRDDCLDSFECGNLGFIKYPFTKVGLPKCGVLQIQGCDDHNKNASKYVQLTKGGKLFQVTNVDTSSWSTGNTISIIDQNLTKFLQKNACEAFSYDNITLPPPSPFGLFYIKDNITVVKCTKKLVIKYPPNNFFKNRTCPHYDFYFGDSISDSESNQSFASCSLFHLPINELGFALSGNPFPYLADQITFQFQPSDFCRRCHRNTKGHCGADSNGQPYCFVR